MDRQEIQRRDFPTGRRGYEPSAVDEHLRRVADAFEAHADLTPPTLSGATADQVRTILEAAERSVSELRTRANEEATGHVARVQSAADGLLAKLDALESELGNLLSALRESGERLTRGLADLQAEVARGGATDIPIEEDFAAAAPTTVDDAAPRGERLSAADARDAAVGAGAPDPPDASSSGGAAARHAAGSGPSDASPPRDDAARRAAADQRDAPSPRDDATRSASSRRDAGASGSSSPADGAAAIDGADLAALRDAAAADSAAGDGALPSGADEAGARLIALNMALSGSPREETARYLAEHFSLAEPEALLDDVYARAGR